MGYNYYMKKLLLILVLTVSTGWVYVSYQSQIQTFIHSKIYYSYCDQPIVYRIDSIDPKFSLSKEEFALDAAKASKIWDDAYKKPLFTASLAKDDPEAVSVNLVYDERQSLNTKINNLEKTVSSDKQNLKPKIAEYQTNLANFKEKLALLNTEIENWNQKGGAPPGEYEKLTSRQQAIQKEADELNRMAGVLNLSTQEFNSKVGQLNQTIDTFGNALTLKPEEGIFIGSQNRIEIYFNVNKDELIHTLTHEFGHALGINHNDNSKSIMYPKTTRTLTLSNEDRQGLNEVCKERSRIDLIKERFIQLSAFFYS